MPDVPEDYRGALRLAGARPPCGLPLVGPMLAHPNDAGGQLGHLRVLFRRLSALAPLSEAEMRVLRGLAADACYHPPHHDLRVAGPSSMLWPRLIVAGWACRYRMLPDGRRQIVSLRLPGDLVGSVLWPGSPSPCAVAALAGLETMNARPLAEAVACADPPYPGLTRAVRLMAHLDDALLCDQVVRLGRQRACERLAHLMLELRERLAQVGLAEDGRFAMPLTQDVLADTLGLSVVYLNRTVQQLRRDGLLDIRSGTVTLLDPERLQDLAGWTPPPGRPAPRETRSQSCNGD